MVISSEITHKLSNPNKFKLKKTQKYFINSQKYFISYFNIKMTNVFVDNSKITHWVIIHSEITDGWSCKISYDKFTQKEFILSEITNPKITLRL